jgi:hypothetical protein
MVRRLLFAFAFAVCLGLSWLGAAGQQVVHALTGTVSSIDPADKTITVFLDSGSEGVFKDSTNTKVPSSLDKRFLADSTAEDAFKKKGSYVIVFYFGGRDTRTAVALRGLGTGPFTAVDGTVAKFESHDHAISVEDKSGAVQTFKISGDTVAEGNMGAVGGLKFQPQKGDHMRIVAATENGNATALFVSQM